MYRNLLRFFILVCILAGALVMPAPAAYAQDVDHESDSAASEDLQSDPANPILLSQSVTQTKWSALGMGDAINGQVRAIAINGTDVYVGGSFTNAGGVPEADYIARWDGAKWHALGSSGAGNGALNLPVDALAFMGGDLYVGGSFTNAGGVALTSHLARWNGSTWSAVGANGLNSALNARVLTIAIKGSDLYVGGEFDNAGGIAAADRLAKWNGSTWSALGSYTGNGVFNGAVMAIAFAGSDLYAGGTFGSAPSGLNWLAKWDGTSWSNVNGMTNPVYALAVSGNSLYAGGLFQNLSVENANYLARLDLNSYSWYAVGSGTAINQQVRALAIFGGDLYVGGNFTSAGGVGAANYLAKWNGSAWSAVNANASLNHSVSAIAIRMGLPVSVYAGGYFDNVPTNDAYTGNANYVALYGPTTTFFSAASQDGRILESSETSNKGGNLNKGASTLNVGDDAANKQYRAILSFDTALPSDSNITSVRLLFKYAGKKGTLPFSTHGNLLVDVRKGPFSNKAALQLDDFNAKSSKNNILAFNNTQWNGWYVKQLSPAHFQYINTSGVTQFRLRFKLDDNNDFGADFLKLYSGNADPANQPQLIVEYTPKLIIHFP